MSVLCQKCQRNRKNNFLEKYEYWKICLYINGIMFRVGKQCMPQSKQ